MNNPSIEARELIAQAREALRRGNKASARQLGERAAFLSPGWQDVWLILTASDPNPQEARAYAQKALELNPQSERARRAVEWASNRLKPSPPAPGPSALTQPSPVSTPTVQAKAATPLPQKQAYQTAVAMPILKTRGRNWLPILGIGAALALLGFLAVFIVAGPVLVSMINRLSAPASSQENLWAPMEIAKPGTTPIGGNAFAAQAGDTPVPTSIPPRRATSTVTPAREPPQAPTDFPTQASTVLPAATETPAGAMVMEVLDDTPTSEVQAPTPGITVGDGERWIDVDLTNQMVYAYEGDTLVNSFLVSTGTWLTPTVTGSHKIYVKVRVQDMSGPGYHLRDVPYVMFFHGDYGLHGTYWHNNFGTPMSRGCINLTIDDAAWLFNWASVGTIVNVHY
jgi:lipoprotein-anchoring transpeptidase ErfK/SrfK